MEKRNKKFHTFTRKQIERDKLYYKKKNINIWSEDLKYYPYIGRGAPAYYVRFYNRSFRSECKQILKYSFMYNEDPVFSLSGRHTAAWDWW